MFQIHQMSVKFLREAIAWASQRVINVRFESGYPLTLNDFASTPSSSFGASRLELMLNHAIIHFLTQTSVSLLVPACCHCGHQRTWISQQVPEAHGELHGSLGTHGAGDYRELRLNPDPKPIASTLLRASDRFGHTWTRTLWRAPDQWARMDPSTCQKECQNRCQIECHKECQIERQNVCQVECQKACRIECQVEWPDQM